MQDNGSIYAFYDVIIRYQLPQNNIFARAVNLLVSLSLSNILSFIPPSVVPED